MKPEQLEQPEPGDEELQDQLPGHHAPERAQAGLVVERRRQRGETIAERVGTEVVQLGPLLRRLQEGHVVEPHALGERRQRRVRGAQWNAQARRGQVLDLDAQEPVVLVTRLPAWM